LVTRDILKRNDVTRDFVMTPRARRRNLLRTFRRRARLTQRELAELLGYTSESQVSHLERGSRVPKLTNALILELVLGRSSRDLFPEIVAAVADLLRRRIDHLVARIPQAERLQSRVKFKLDRLAQLRASLPAPVPSSAVASRPCPTPPRRRAREKS
jgi:transcriptional regulator with XRE-family HTH domain